MSAEIRPIVVVKDMNNEPPQFEGLDPSLSNSFKGSVLEEEQPGQSVITIKAVDPDYDPPNNVVCWLASSLFSYYWLAFSLFLTYYYLNIQGLACFCSVEFTGWRF